MKNLIYLLVIITTISCKKEIKGNIIISNINIVDVETGEIIPSQDVIIIGNRIDKIQNHQDNNDYNAQNIINGKDKYLIPGLWDMHTHILWRLDEFCLQNKMMIANGVTGFRDMWGSDSIAGIVKSKMKLGELPNQRIYRSNHMIDGPPEMWEGSGEVKNAKEARQLVDSILQNTDSDFIKVYTSLSKESFLAIANRCKELGIDFVGHIPESLTLEEAISAGMKSTEHLYGFKIALSNERDFFYNNPDIDAVRRHVKVAMFPSNDRIDTVSSTLLQNNTAVVPTFTITLGLDKAMKDNISINESIYSEYIPLYRKQKWKRPNIIPPEFDSLFKARIRRDFEIIELLNNRGVRILAGTDTAFSNPFTYAGFSLHEELQHLVSAGLTPH